MDPQTLAFIIIFVLLGCILVLFAAWALREILVTDQTETVPVVTTQSLGRTMYTLHRFLAENEKAKIFDKVREMKNAAAENEQTREQLEDEIDAILTDRSIRIDRSLVYQIQDTEYQSKYVPDSAAQYGHRGNLTEVERKANSITEDGRHSPQKIQDLVDKIKNMTTFKLLETQTERETQRRDETLFSSAEPTLQDETLANLANNVYKEYTTEDIDVKDDVENFYSTAQMLNFIKSNIK